MNNYILDYIGSGTRHKIIISSFEHKGLRYADIGKSLSLKIKSESTASKISLIAQSELEKIMNDSLREDLNLGAYIAIKNLGILLEPNLKLDITAFFSRYSGINPLFIQWRGAMKQNKLHFLTEKNGVTINLDNISHIIA